MPDDDDIANIPNLAKAVPGAMPYFYVQDPDYATLKERIAKHCPEEALPPLPQDEAEPSAKAAQAG